MKSVCVIVLLLHHVTLSRSEQIEVVGSPGTLLAVTGEDLVLPCSLKPSVNAVDMTVEWFRLHTKDSLVHLYEDGADKNKDQIQSYRGRTVLFKEELQRGNVSLKLFRVRASDEGEYKCFIRSESWYDDVIVKVSVKEQIEVVGPSGTLLAVTGEDLVLPCSLKPSVNAMDMTVEWFRLHTKDSLVHLYEDGADKNKDQIQSYRGRTVLFKEELQRGNVSLKLFRVRASDEGEYKCFIRSESWYDDVTIKVSVEGYGTHPVITVDGYDYVGRLRLFCETKGWTSEPEVLLLDSEGTPLTEEARETFRDSDGIYVKQTAIAKETKTNRFVCRVKLQDYMKEVEIVVSDDVTRTWKDLFICFSVFTTTITAAIVAEAVLSQYLE